MYAISTRNLSRHFGKLTAVSDLNLKIPAGSLFGLIGPNGAGKTTTLRMLAGLLEPSEGDIRINELSIKQYFREFQWQIGFMPDFFGVYDNLLVWEYLDFYARCYKLPTDRRKRVIDELLELVDLSDKRDAYVQTLSRGMCQRLCLAHALIHDPQVLLLDEPASGLDPRARVEMRALLYEMRNMGKTILLSSHILSDLAELCDSVAIMEKGQLVASGALEDILHKSIDNRYLSINVLGDPEGAKAVLEQDPYVKSIEQLPSQYETTRFEVEFSGDTEAAADLLDDLVRKKVRVSAFNETLTDLEEAFLRLTKGEVA